ncbi:MAG: hypothetical protein H2057_04420 [Alphaproteobacteria bacterium]|nr:hypothetical protein [Alphaproteobacteria bacterium]
MLSATFFTQLAGIISFLGFIPYLIGILKKRVIPSFTTWLVWSIIGMILLVSYIKTTPHLTASVWVPLSYALGPCVICILSLKSGLERLGKMDFVCLAIALASLVLSFIIHNFYISLFLGIFADLLGAWPTVVKSYKDPGSEDLTAWLFFLTGNVLNASFIEYNLSSIYPLYLLGISLIIVFFLLKGKRDFILKKKISS